MISTRVLPHCAILLLVASVLFLTATDSSAALVNVAPAFGTASQSTTGYSLPAPNAIDGNTATQSHTNSGDMAPYWEVDLGTSFFIESLNLVTRVECCTPASPERDYNLTIEVFDDVGGVAFTNPVINPWDGTPPGATDIGNGASFSVDLTGLPGGGVDGQRVRVSKAPFAGTEWLSIAELEVWADITVPPELDPNVNVALYKPTTGDVAYGRPTANGNDGVVGGGNFTHANNTNPPPDNPFWQVDLQGEFDLTRVEVVDRGDGCCDPNRFEGSIVSVLAADGTTVLFESDPITGLTVPSSGETVGFDFSPPLSGSAFVRVDGFTQYFQFSELRAYQIPEPGMLALLAMGGMILLPLWHRRRRRTR